MAIQNQEMFKSVFKSEHQDKKKIIQAIIEQLSTELVSLKQAALATYKAATNEESKPENEYDTRGLEASYLAGAQAERVAEVEELIYHLKELNVINYTQEDKISSTAIVLLRLNKKIFTAILLPKGGGVTVNYQGVPLQIVTPNSPLGEALRGLEVGDLAIVEIGSVTKEYEVLDLV